MEDIGKILIEKLAPEELSELCDSYDDGSLDIVFREELYPRDHQNNPKKYTNVLRKIE